MPQLIPSKTVLKSYGGNKINHFGKCKITLKANGKVQTDDFYITETKSPPILGLSSCQKLGLLRKVDMVDHKESPTSITKDIIAKEFKDVFEGLGCFEQACHIELKNDAVPVCEPPRRVPFALRESLKIKLDSMEEQGVIKKVDKPTEWVHNLVIVEKKDKSLRICLDPRNLNICVKREHYQIPVLEDITSQLSGKHVFTVIDLKEAFWQIPLTKESMLLTTFSTPFGRYCFTRMPFGICSASEVLQKRAYQTFGDIPDVHIIADDMILASENEKEHDHLITTVLERARANNIKFNLHKIQLKKSEVTYMGNILGNGVVKPDYEKVRAIVEMPVPTCKKDIQRLLGMLNYLSQYIPNMSTITVPLRNLLKKDVPFE